MSQPNVHGLPQYLRKDARGFFLDYRVEANGLIKRKRVRLGHIPATQARLVLAEHLKEIVAGKYLAEDKPRVTFNEAAESFLAFSKARKKSFKRDFISVKFLGSFFGARPLESLTPGLVEDYLVWREKEAAQKGRELKGSTLNREIACLKTLVRRALLNRQIDRNPIEGIRLFKEIPRNRTLSDQEYQKLLGACSPHFRPVVQLAYDTGMRRGEILGLKWDQVDLQAGVITLRAAETKTEEDREIPLDEGLKDLFRRIPRVLGSIHVFNFRGRVMKDPKTAFLKACRRANISDFRFHDLRHCAITNFRKAGVSDSTTMSISGHKTHAVFRRYDRIDREDRLEALERVRRFKDSHRTPELSRPRQEIGG